MCCTCRSRIGNGPLPGQLRSGPNKIRLSPIDPCPPRKEKRESPVIGKQSSSFPHKKFRASIPIVGASRFSALAGKRRFRGTLPVGFARQNPAVSGVSLLTAVAKYFTRDDAACALASIS